MIEVWGAGTSRTLRAHWMLRELGLSYDTHAIGSRSGETTTDAFLALNPKGKIPVLVDDDFVLTESAAIVHYLQQRYRGVTDTLASVESSRAQARYQEWASFIQMELDAHTLYVMRKHQDLADLYGEAPAAIAEARAGFTRQSAVAARALERREYLLDEGFSGVDILLASCLAWARVYGMELAAVFEPYLERLSARPAFAPAYQLNFSITPDGRPGHTAQR